MKSVDEVAGILSGAGAAYALIGGHAVNAVLEPRFTADIDVTIAADVAALQRVRSALLAAGFRVEREHCKAFTRFFDAEIGRASCRERV